MISKYIDSLLDELKDDICFLWVSIGKGELQKQSYKSVKNELNFKTKCSLLEDEFFGPRTIIEEHEIVFLNWEKIRTKEKDTNDWKNSVMKDKETNNFIEVLENTRHFGRKIILIIDESHSSSTTERARELRDEIVKPELTIEMSATPLLTRDYDAIIKVDPSEVINEGMIKKEILINPDIEIIQDDEMNSQQLVLEMAFKKREELATLYNIQGSEVNPLVLIQLPNSTLGDDKKEAVESFLREKGINEGNGKLAIWLNDEKINNDSDTLIPFKSNVEYLIFKQAIDTGWDCPRAQVLVRFRETQSIVFEVQTLGRILRMPEGKHYMEDKLNAGYVYTNIQSIDVKKEIYNPNIIKSLKSNRREIYNPIKLNSYYRQRTDYGDITSSFTETFEDIFCKKNGFDKNTMIQNYIENANKMKNIGLELKDFNNMDTMLSNINVESIAIDNFEKIDENYDSINVNYAANDLQAEFDLIIKDNLNGFAPKRSVSKVSTAIYVVFNKYLNLSKQRNGFIYIQNIIVKNKTFFSQLIDEAVKAYKPVQKEKIDKKTEEKHDPNWEILPTRNYNPETYTKYKSHLSLYEPLYIFIGENDKTNDLETAFIDYIDSKADKIDWIWQNGQDHLESNFGIRKSDGSTFQPDFIVQFKDGRIGIFDTKGIGQREDDNLVKATALQKYVEESRCTGKNVFGGLLVKDGKHFKINLKDKYKPYLENPEEWGYLNDII